MEAKEYSRRLFVLKNEAGCTRVLSCVRDFMCLLFRSGGEDCVERYHVTNIRQQRAAY